MTLKKSFSIFALAILTLTGAIGEAEAQDEIVITATNLMRVGGFRVSTWVIDNDDVDFVSTEDGSYLAMLVTRRRPALPGEYCKIPFPPPDPLPPCMITERVLQVYNTITSPHTLICSETYSASDTIIRNPKAVKFRETYDHRSIAVLENDRLSFFGLDCNLQYQVQLSDTFDDQYELAYLAFDVAYDNTYPTPTLTVGGGAHNDSQSWGTIAVVRWDDSAFNPLQPEHPGNFVIAQSEILNCDGTVTKVDSEGDESDTIYSGVICENEVDEETVQDTVMAVELTSSNNMTIAIPNFISYRDKAFCSKAEVDAQIINYLNDYNEEIKIGYLANYLTFDEVCRTDLLVLNETGLLHTLSLFPDAPSGVNAIGNIFSVTKPVKFYKGRTFINEITVAGLIDNQPVVETLVLKEDQQTLKRLRGTRVHAPLSSIAALKKKDGKVILVGSAPGDALITFQQLSSAPLGGPGTNDLVIIGLEICSSPITSADLTKIDIGHEEEDEDKGLFEVSFGYIDPYACQPATCTAEFVCEGGESVSVENGQIVEIKIENDECKIKNNDGRLEIKGQAKLIATCSNETGSSVAEALPEGLTADNDEQGEDNG